MLYEENNKKFFLKINDICYNKRQKYLLYLRHNKGQFCLLLKKQIH